MVAILNMIHLNSGKTSMKQDPKSIKSNSKWLREILINNTIMMEVYGMI